MTYSEYRHFIFQYLCNPKRKLNFTLNPGYNSGRVYNFMMKANNGKLELLSKISTDLAFQNNDYDAKNPEKNSGVLFLTFENGSFDIIRNNINKYILKYKYDINDVINNIYISECEYNDRLDFEGHIINLGTKLYIEKNIDIFALLINNWYKKLDLKEISNVANIYNIPIILTHQVSYLNNIHIKESEFMLDTKRNYIDKLVGKEFSSCIESICII